MTGILASKLHAILDRGLRRDFFDLYVMLQQQSLGIASVLAAIRTAYEGDSDDGPMLRALTCFDDADREAPLPGEGRSDWDAVKGCFLTQVGSLITPPKRKLEIQAQVVDVESR